MNNFSPNMLKTFQNCPVKYNFKYNKKIAIPQKASTFEKGKKIHALANYYLRGDNIDKLEKALTSDEKQIWENLKNNEYFKKTCVNSEYNISCKVGDFWIGGRLDALVKDDEFYYILDYKTGTIPQKPEYDFQTMVYLLSASKMFGDKLKFVYIDLKNNVNNITNFDLTKQSEYEKLIIDICKKIESAQLPEEIEHSKSCDFCEYKKICI
ncbi:putative uncharacterized protein [Clostridium sp. CAG:967]|nr:putative uncharacterized protein [Clostridium sp. CAG:967]